MGSTAWTLAELRAHCCSCAKSHAWKQALAALTAQSHSLQLEAVALSATMTACNRASVWPMTLELLQMAGQTGAATVVVYNGALTACDKGHQWQMALEILSALTQQDLQPSSISFGAALSACQRCGRWQEALWLLQETLEPNIILMNSAIAACAAKNDGWQFASLILYSSLCQNLQPTATTLTSTLRSYGLGEQWQKALSLYSQLSPMLETNVITRNAFKLHAPQAVLGK